MPRRRPIDFGPTVKDETARQKILERGVYQEREKRAMEASWGWLAIIARVPDSVRERSKNVR